MAKTAKLIREKTSSSLPRAFPFMYCITDHTQRVNTYNSANGPFIPVSRNRNRICSTTHRRYCFVPFCFPGKYASAFFKFKNNRNYPIKIVAGVENGGVHVSIYGLKTPDDYQVEIFSNYIGSGTYQTYKKLIKDGQEVSTELISTDTYHGRH